MTTREDKADAKQDSELREALIFMRDCTPEQLAEWNIFMIENTFKKSILRNGSLLVGYLMRALSSYAESAKRHGIANAKFYRRIKVEHKLRHVWDTSFYRISCHVKTAEGITNQDQRAAEIAQIMCKKLTALVHSEMSVTFNKS